MFSFIYKKIMGVWSSEVKCIKCMDKLEVIKKTKTNKACFSFVIT